MQDRQRFWKVLRSEYLAREPWFTARRDTVQLPTGKQIPAYYVMEYPDWVNVIAITTDGQFVMVKQYRHGLRSVCYELCAGVCDATDASPMAAAQRELLEETGYGRGVWEEYMDISANASTMSNITHCFIARGVEKVQEQHLEPTEDLTVHLLEPAEVRRILACGEIKQALMAAPLWRYFAEQASGGQ